MVVSVFEIELNDILISIGLMRSRVASFLSRLLGQGNLGNWGGVGKKNRKKRKKAT